MKRYAIIALMAATATISAADLAFQKGTHAIGVGANLDFGRGIGAAVAWDMGAINDMFSFGAEMKFSVDHDDLDILGFTNEWSYTYISPEFRFAFHPFGIPSLKGKVSAANKLDAYVVAHTGPSFQKWSHTYKTYKDENFDVMVEQTDKDGDVGFNFGTAVGARFFFTDMFGVWGEVDWDRTLLGVNFKF